VSIKDIRRQVRGKVCPVWTFCRYEVVLKMQTSTLFGAKYLGFFEVYDMCAQSGELRQYGHFADKWSQFCADIFYGWPLTQPGRTTGTTF